MYEIIDGVRRSKAAQMHGHTVIRAKLYHQSDGRLLQELDVLIDQLRSPHKTAIRLISQAEKNRWQRVVHGAVKHPLPYPPIEVVDGRRGAAVKDIFFDYGAGP